MNQKKDNLPIIAPQATAVDILRMGGQVSTLFSQMNKFRLPAEPARTKALNRAMAYGIPMEPTRMQMDDDHGSNR